MSKEKERSMNVQRRTLSLELLQAALNADELAIRRLINLGADVNYHPRAGIRYRSIGPGIRNWIKNTELTTKAYNQTRSMESGAGAWN